MLDRYYKYLEDLLFAQYSISETVEHKLTRGEMREAFIKNQITNLYPNIRCCKGVLIGSDGKGQSGQIDIVIPKQMAREMSLGEHAIFPCEDVNIVIEVKSDATGNDFKEWNEKSLNIKRLKGKNHPLTGIVCYRYKLTRENLLKRFAFSYDEDLEAFFYDKNMELAYPNIDFVLAIENDEGDSNKSLFLRKDIQEEYVLYLEMPISKYFFNLIGSR